MEKIQKKENVDKSEKKINLKFIEYYNSILQLNPTEFSQFCEKMMMKLPITFRISKI